jgi:hypothetical protein
MNPTSLNEPGAISNVGARHSAAGRARETASPMAGATTAFVLAVYALLIAFTRTLDQGDTGVYADDIVKHLHGQTSDFWDFGHPIWRPLGYVLLRLFSPSSVLAPDPVAYARATTTLTALSIVGGATAIVCLVAWLRRLGFAAITVAAIAAGFSCSAAFLGYAQTGASYVPALGMLALGLSRLALADDDPTKGNVLWASVAFAAGVLFWFPIVLAVPAAAISMVVLRGNSALRRRVAISACAISGSVTVVAYLIIARAAGVHSIAEFKAWMSHSANGVSGIGGLPRVIVGFARSVVNMDRLGLIAKRHLIHDPYNPTTWGDILSAGLLKLLVFYAILAVIAVVLLRREFGRRVLVFLLLTAIPVVGFAFMWQGGDLERYLAMFPALFRAIAVAVAALPDAARLGVVGVGVILLAAANVPAVSRGKSRRECASLTARLEAIPRATTGPTMVITPHAMDEIASFRARCPNAVLLAQPSAPRVNGLVMPNTKTAPAWRDTLAARAARAWAQGGHLWISRRAFRATPAADWKWAEGDEPAVRWRDFPAYFDSVDVGPPVGGVDGFVELLQTPRTRRQLRLTPHE